MQREQTEYAPLLDGKGNLAFPGYAKRFLWQYDRRQVRGGLTRLKEWDYYLVMNDHFGVALTVADKSYMGLDSISFLNFDEGWQVTKSPMRLFPMGTTALPPSSGAGVTAISGHGYGLCFRVENGVRKLNAHMDRFRDGRPIDVTLTLTGEPEESMVIATPFSKAGHFYYNQKINCMRAQGTVEIGGNVWRFTPQNSFGTLDWGRGVWTYRNTWYWGSASGEIEGTPFGFNIGCGFGDTSAATENMLFYGGKAHKLSQVDFHIPQKGGRDDFLAPWRFTSDDGRFEMTFRPRLDRAACTNVGVLKSNQHQVFGAFTGSAILDGGRRIELEDFMGFAEKVENRW